MKQHDIPQCLHDILTAIGHIEDFLGPRRDFNVYQQSKLLQSGVERQLEIIGEATNRINQTDPAFRLTNTRNIVDLRNRVSHGYDSISHDAIWVIVVKHLPPLKEEVLRLLAQ